MYVVFTGKAVQTVTPPPSSVGLAQFNATGSPGTNTFLRGDNSWATPSDSVSYLVKISADDTTPDFLNGKLVAGTGISLTEGSGGGDETLTVANTATTRPNENPLIINGDFAVAQRTSSGTSLASVSSGSNFVSDRFSFGPATAGTWTISQEAITSGSPFDNGFRTAFKADNTTANGSLSAGSSLQFAQKIEAQNLQLLKYGSSNAEKLTLAFWIKATKTGTNVIEIYAHDSGRSVSIAYTVSSSNTWEYKVVNLPADTGGTINNDSGTGLEFIWWLAAGTNFTSGSLQTSWGANSATARAVGQVNHADSTSNNVHIAGVQLEVGEYTSATIPPFLNETFADNLFRCKRYYQEMNRPSYGVNTMLTGITTNGNQMFMMRLPVSMRSAPTISMTGTVVTVYSSDSSGNVSALNPTLNASTFGTDGGRILYSKIGDIGHGAWVDIDNDNTSMNFAAEL